MAMRVSTYLFFRTECEAALAHYAAGGLGAVVELVRHGAYGPPRTPAMAGLVQHAEFCGPGVLLYASDNDDAEPMKGSAVLLETDDLDEARRLFAHLSQGGRVTVPFGPQPWGAAFGMATDAFGVQWMVNCETGAT